MNFKSHFRFLSRNKLYTFINVLGLSLSLMFVIYIANFTIGEFTTDSFQEKADKIYVLGNETYAGSSYSVGSRLQSRYPEIDKICSVVPVGQGQEFTVKIINDDVHGKAIAVDSTFFDLFSFELKMGNRDNVLASRNSMVISERFAKKAFGDIDPIGQGVVFKDEEYIVNGVVEDFKNTMFNYTDMIIRIEKMESYTAKTHGGVALFIQAVEGADIASKTDDMLEYFKTFFNLYKNNVWKEVTLTPMVDLYLSETIGVHSSFHQGDVTLIRTLLAVGLVILVFAIFNYINLTVAQTGFRAKEVSMRRLLGSSKESVFFKMIFESILLCAVAFIIGLFFAIGVEPYANDLIRTDISIIGNFSVLWILFYVAFIVVIGAISGLIPAVVISRFKPIDVIKGAFTFNSKMIYSKVFIIIQSAITVILIACSITMVKQVKHMLDFDLGYNQSGIININSHQAFKMTAQREAFLDQIEAFPFVKNIANSLGTPLYVGGRELKIIVDGEEKSVVLDVIHSEWDVVDMLDFEVIQDNKVTSSSIWTPKVWINESAAREIGLTEGAGNVNISGKDVLIAGVIKDFHIGNALSEKNKGLILYIHESLIASNILVEVEGDLINSYKEIEKVFRDVTDGGGFNAQFLDQQVAECYEDENRISTIIMIFTFIAIIISSLGLLAMSTYFIQQRSLEVSIRKVFGSTTSQVLKKLVWQFLRLVLVAFVIACPIIWYAMSEWLQGFSYRIDLSIWIFVVAGLFTLSISFLTVFWQSSIAANSNPVDSIKR